MTNSIKRTSHQKWWRRLAVMLPALATLVHVVSYGLPNNRNR